MESKLIPRNSFLSVFVGSHDQNIHQEDNGRYSTISMQICSTRHAEEKSDDQIEKYGINVNCFSDVKIKVYYLH